MNILEIRISAFLDTSKAYLLGKKQNYGSVLKRSKDAFLCVALMNR